MKSTKLLPLGITLFLLLTLAAAAGAQAPDAPSLAGCTPGTDYDPACDVDHDGDVDLIDVQLAAGHWGSTGTYPSSDHDHFGELWLGNDYTGLELRNSSTNNAAAGVAGWSTANSGMTFGVFGRSDSPDGAGVYALGAGEHIPDLILGGTSPSNDNGVIFSDMTYPGSDLFLRSNDDVGIHLDRNNDEEGRFYLYRGEGTVIFRLDEQGGLRLKDEEDKVVFEVNEAGGAQFNTGAPGLRVNTVPVLGRALAPADTMISTPDDSPNSKGDLSSITIGADGLGLISYSDYSFGDLRVAHCDNVACTSATVTVHDAASWAGYDTSIAIGADGLGLISYQGLDLSGANPRLKVAHCEDIACTSATITTLDMAGGSSTSLVIGTDGLGLISYYAGGNLKVAHCNNTACTSATLSNLGGGGEPTVLTLGADGLGLIAFDGGLSVYVAHCNNVACTSATVNQLFVYVGCCGGAVHSVAIGEDGLGLVGFSDSGELQIAHCDNLLCSDASFALIDSGSWSSSITIGMDGLPLISYWDKGNRRVQVAHCMEQSCAESSIAILDSIDDLDSFSAVTIGADGLPLVSYYDDVIDDLKVAHCSNPFCVPHFRRR
ncbi:MAG: hypothetical protein U9R25_07310 [Chloroflexota bacterium]|nr:hypothetical protein [Chloroflexota bacterium]